MRRGTTAGLVLVLVLLLAAGCREGDTFDSLVKAKVKLYVEKARILEGVKDRKTAEEARPRLEDVNKRIKEIDERRGRLARDKNPDAAFTTALKAEQNNSREIHFASRRLAAAREKVLAIPEAAKVLEGIDLK